MRQILKKAYSLWSKIQDDHVGAYAAQAAFFMMISLVPIVMLLMILVRHTPVAESDILSLIHEFFPRTIRFAMIAIVDEVYRQTGTTISITALVAVWSAGRGVLAMANGLNVVQGIHKTQNYLLLRLRATAYTVVFLVAIILTLVFLGFGNDMLTIEIRTALTLGLLFFVNLLIYRFLPNKGRPFKKQLAGAAFTSCGWVLASFLVSIYVDLFKGFSNMYGSLTTIVLIMLWLYFCMYVMLLGGEINNLLAERLDNF